MKEYGYMRYKACILESKGTQDHHKVMRLTEEYPDMYRRYLSEMFGK
jgi:hypothetical protein